MKNLLDAIRNAVATVDRRVQSGLPEGTLAVGMPSYIGGPKAVASGMKTLYGAVKGANPAVAEMRAAMAAANRNTAPFRAIGRPGVYQGFGNVKDLPAEALQAAKWQPKSGAALSDLVAAMRANFGGGG